MKDHQQAQAHLEKIEFAGWGEALLVEDLSTDNVVHKLDSDRKHFLNEWKSTALCGNDITSSCLYVSALCILQAGALAPIVLLIVGFTLYVFRKIYAEVGSALPLNGGTYTLLLNTTTKKVAAAAACLTLLSYIATAVISATEAISYLRVILPSIDLNTGTVVHLVFFALLVIMGVGESASVALGIFILHILTLGFLILGAGGKVLFNPEILIQNIQHTFHSGSLLKSLFFGFSVALLGISGFESSSNFIEEQQRGVFPKTLKNMWLAVAVLNPLIALVAIGMFPLTEPHRFGEGFLASVAKESMGEKFAFWIGLNAFLVLSGAVITSFVGVLGLVRRMTLDRCLPQFLLIENRWRKTNHWIVLSFLAICLSIFSATRENPHSLAGIYTISFLLVMIFYAIGNSLLKVSRGKLPREEYAPWAHVATGGFLVTAGLIGNLILSPESSSIFLTYFLISASLVLGILLRTRILRFMLHATQYSVHLLPPTKALLSKVLTRWIGSINAVPVIYFSRGDNLAALNRAALYVLENEQTNGLQICHIFTSKGEIPKTLAYQVRVIDELYPSLKIDLLLAKGKFGPHFIEALSNRLKVEKNRMFIGTPGDKFPLRIDELGGVRVIL